ncbi:glycosyltransferase family 4 protein [Bacillus sp. ISL-75]|uniref:glycosyltransferase family 4 protein n=1 Tax=Bacillus sp. ISL-75 TaxID=2819137 RepID=UPI001BE7859E|nr:glycosyltransferase family 4 protein [Bacillus sp. ISL-75]MBT2730136.1 glycosyltransferase family 4 protein [Bacillus sp. ISL-75]
MKIAIIHDWLITYAGAEKVLEQMLEVYPEADLFSVVDFIQNDERKFIKNKTVKTTFIQKLPFAKKKYRSYLPLMPLAIEQLDLSSYEIIISSSHAVAKGVITGPDQLHISYVHSPIRYAWDLQHQYLKEANLENGIKGIAVKFLLHKIRNWDYRTSNGVDIFLSNSSFISRRIWKVYRREAKVVYPPVDVSSFTIKKDKSNFYMTASRMVPYKKIDIIVDAFSKMPDKELIVIGDGPDFNKIKQKAGKNVKLLGYQSFDILKEHMQNAIAFIFAAEEDFGITPVEAQACGTPVIAYGKGGALETVEGIDSSNEPTGLHFYEQSADSIVSAVHKFEDNIHLFSAENCRRNALKFSEVLFRDKLREIVETEYAKRKK